MNTQVVAIIQAAVICCGGVGGYMLLTHDSGDAADCTVTITVDGNGTVDTAQVAVKKGTEFSSDGNKLYIGKKTVTATADEGSIFKGWNPDKGKVDGDMKIAATFVQGINYTVTITAGTGGTVSKTSVTVNSGTTFNSNGDKLSIGTDIVLATPNQGYSFSNWTPASGTVMSDMTITASFSSGADTFTFYFTDNFDNDQFEPEGAVYDTDQKAIIPGVWIDANGSVVSTALKAACDKFGIELKVEDGKITKISDVEDGNIYFWGWDATASEWCSKTSSGEYITLADLDQSSYTYIAVVHGATDVDGNAPEVNSTPDNITWKYGISGTPGKGKEVKFFVTNNFDYSKLTSTRTDTGYRQSDPTTFLVRGIWISGWANYGELVMVALMNALDRIGFDYDIDPGFIKSINDCTGGNFLQAEWDMGTDNWYQDTWTHFFGADYVDDVDYASAVYGQWGGETGYDIPPWPRQDMHDCTWSY